MKGRLPRPGLQSHLERFLDRFPARLRRERDPVGLVHRYGAKSDREVAAFIASAFAYGGVAHLLKTVAGILGALGPRPAEAVRSFSVEEGRERFRGFVHRFHRGGDLVALLWLLRRALETWGSLEGLFRASLAPDDRDVGPALVRFTAAILALDPRPALRGARLPPGAPVRFFFPSPAAGSACKRLCLFLRWLVRGPDGIDLGDWAWVGPHRLVVPLDAHLAKISFNLGFSRAPSPSWSRALEVTEALRRFSPRDPLRYDFPLCHWDMEWECPSRRVASKCAPCEFRPFCRVWPPSASRRLRPPAAIDEFGGLR